MWTLSTGGLEVVNEPEFERSAPRAAEGAPTDGRPCAVVRCAVIATSMSVVLGGVGADGLRRRPAFGPAVEVLPCGGHPS